MLEVQWEYFKENICRDGLPVATLKTKSSNQTILDVYESRNAHYSVLSPNFSFINLENVRYDVEASIVRQKYKKEKLASLSAEDILGLRLEEGCKIIEESFLEQVKKIIGLIS